MIEVLISVLNHALQAQRFGLMSPDPFPGERAGPGSETMDCYICPPRRGCYFNAVIVK